jgi:CheY-like chemotaxis protein
MALAPKDTALYTALVVDDEESSRELARIALEQLGFTDISLVSDGALALLAMERMQRQPDLVVCDIFMPQSDGIELVTALAERQYGGALVLISGGDSQYLVIAKRIARFHGLSLLGSLTKPIRTEALAQALFGAPEGEA